MSEKQNRYFVRTVEHIHRVQKNMVYLVTECRAQLEFKDIGERFVMTKEVCRKLVWNVMNHDRSKFSETQFEPYIELTEYYRQRKKLGNKDYDYLEGVREYVDIAVQDHYVKENHHPERMKDNPGRMPFIELVEVVCDLQAMAQEFGEGSCRGYFDNVWKKGNRKNFYPGWDWKVTQKFMSQVIKCFEDKND